MMLIEKLSSFVAVINLVVLQSYYCDAFGVAKTSSRLPSWCRGQQKVISLQLSNSPEAADAESAVPATPSDNDAARKEAIGNLVADDEWMGLSMELSELVRVAVVEDLKKNVRDLIQKDDYKVGDISKAVDARVKQEVALLRNKEEYELGDLALAADELSKSFTEQLTGKAYEPGDLSIELDKRIKTKVAEFCGKDEYSGGDLTKEIVGRIEKRTLEFVNKSDSSYEFGDISREIENRRRQWVKDFLGEEAAANYTFGSITKQAIGNFIGKPAEEYQFGDVTKKVFGDLFGPRKRGGDGNQK